MKSKKNFQKSKKTHSFDEEREMKVKKVGSPQKKKNFKKEIFDELEDDEEIDLFGNKENYDEDEDDDSDY